MIDKEIKTDAADDDDAQFLEFLKSLNDEEMVEYAAKFRAVMVKMVEDGNLAAESLDEFDRLFENYKTSKEKARISAEKAEQSKRELELATDAFEEALFDELERRGGKPFMVSIEKTPKRDNSH